MFNISNRINHDKFIWSSSYFVNLRAFRIQKQAQLTDCPVGPADSVNWYDCRSWDMRILVYVYLAPAFQVLTLASVRSWSLWKHQLSPTSPDSHTSPTSPTGPASPTSRNRGLCISAPATSTLHLLVATRCRSRVSSVGRPVSWLPGLPRKS